MQHNVNTQLGLLNAILGAQAGDVIKLAPGDYGDITIHGSPHNKVIVGNEARYGASPVLTGQVTIRSADFGNRASVGVVDIEGAWWTLQNLSILPGWRHEFSGPSVNLAGDDTAIIGCTLTHDNDPTGWTPQEWQERAGHGIQIKGARVKASGNYISTVATGIQVLDGSPDARVEFNSVSGIHRDAFRCLSSDATIAYNYAEKWRIGDAGNHWDGLQCWRGNQQFGGTLRNLVVRGNFFYAPHEPEVANYVPCMGITVTHTIAENWLVEHNVIATDNPSGILFYDARGVTVRKNTVVDIRPGGFAKRAVIRVNGDAACVIEGNLTNRFDPTSPMQMANNAVITEAEYDSYFQDWQAGNFTLIDPAGPGATITPRNQPLPIKTPPVVPATVESWQVMEIGGKLEAVRVIEGASAPLTEAEARALAGR